MNQRQFPKETRFVPPVSNIVETISEKPANIEDIVFDKAERATKVDRLRKRLRQNGRLLIELGKEDDSSTNGDDLKPLRERKISLLKHQNKRLKNYLKNLEIKNDSGDENNTVSKPEKDLT